MLRFLTCGESHGQALSVILDGIPAGLRIDVETINHELWRRQQGYGRGNRQKIEQDQVEILSGIRHGITTGAPIGLTITNKDWHNWQHIMSVTPVEKNVPEVMDLLTQKAVNKFRPGHADLAGTIKFRHTDIRDVIERASARETAARVAMGAICHAFLNTLNITIASHVIQIGSVQANFDNTLLNAKKINEQIVDSELFCLDIEATMAMKNLIRSAWQKGNSLGGIIEIVGDGLPVGLGSYTQWDRRLDGKLAQSIMSIHAIKAVEIGDGVRAATKLGSEVHDALYQAEKDSQLPFKRKTNRAGGIEGGMTNGEQLLIHAFMKPIPTMLNGIDSLSFPGFQPAVAHYERSDVCAAAAASVVCKAMTCFTLAEAILDKFGGDSLIDVQTTMQEYQKYCHQQTKSTISSIT